MSTAFAASGTVQHQRKPLLIVEDSDEDFDTVQEALRKSGLTCEIYRAESGQDCLALLRGTDGTMAIDPDLVLMDLNTPGLDGRSALREIKTDPHLQPIPVVVFTTSSNPRDLRACYEYGANAYHLKPVQYPEHLKVLQEIFDYWLQWVIGLKNGKKSFKDPNSSDSNTLQQDQSGQASP